MAGGVQIFGARNSQEARMPGIVKAYGPASLTTGNRQPTTAIISPLKEPQKMAREIALALANRKAGDVLVMDIREVAPFIADFFILATALTHDHARALADEATEVLLGNDLVPHHTEGYERARWILVDADEVVVHIMTQDAREFYAIESLWGDARIERYGDKS